MSSKFLFQPMKFRKNNPINTLMNIYLFLTCTRTVGRYALVSFWFMWIVSILNEEISIIDQTMKREMSRKLNG